MTSLNLRKYNQAILEAELEGRCTYEGPPCKYHADHVNEGGTTTRDTVKRTCTKCEYVNKKRRRAV